MKKLLLILIGLLPFGLGFLMNAMMMAALSNLVLPYKLIGLIWLLLWGCLGYWLSDKAHSPRLATGLSHIIPLAVLLLLLYQELIVAQYWASLFGFATQFYYLPLLNLAFTLTFWARRIWPAYIVAFFLMCLVFYLGCRLKQRRLK